MEFGLLLQYREIITLLVLCAGFLGIVAYALWPGMGPSFDRAARLPLNED